MRRALAGALLLGCAGAAVLLVPGLLTGRLPARGDLPDFFWPMKWYTARRWLAGSPPLWNPLSGCGEPWLAKLQTGVFYPGDAPFLLPWPFGPPVAIALHLAVAASGMAAWLSALGRSRLAALSGAVLFVFGGAFLSLVPVWANFTTGAWLPWIFLGARRTARGEGVATFPLASSLAFLAGEPALAAAGSVAAAGAAFVSTRDVPFVPAGGPRRAAARLAGGLLLGAALTAVTAVPFVLHLRESGRIVGATREEALARPVRISDLSDVLWPPPDALTRSPAAGRGGYLATLALGPLPFALALSGLAGALRTRLGVALTALLALGFALSLGAAGGLMPFLWDVGPARGLRFPARWFVLAQLALAVFAAVGVDAWRSEEPEARRAALAGLGVSLLLSAGLLPLAGPARLQGDGLARVILSMVAAAAGFALLRWRPETSAAFLLVLGAPLLWFSSGALATAPAQDLVKAPAIVADLPRGDGARVLVAVHDAELFGRWFAAGGGGSTEEAVRRERASLSGYGNLFFGLPTAGTASPIESPRRARLLGAALAGGDPAAILALANVRYLVTPYASRIPGASLSARDGPVYRFELPRPVGRIFFPREARSGRDETAFEAIRTPGFDPEEVAWVAADAGPLPPRRSRQGYSIARFERDAPERTDVAVTASEPGLLVFTRSWDPGWKASLDGAPAPVERVDLAFLGLTVPAGEHRVVLTYEPPGYRAGSLASGAALAVLLAAALAGRSPPRGRL